jgi:hypothetical protein
VGRAAIDRDRCGNADLCVRRVVVFGRFFMSCSLVSLGVNTSVLQGGIAGAPRFCGRRFGHVIKPASVKNNLLLSMFCGLGKLISDCMEDYAVSFARLMKSLAAGALALLGLASAPVPAGADSNIAVLAFGLFGAQSVFESEAKAAANIVARSLGANAVIQRANTKTRQDVTLASIQDDLQGAGQRMERESDLLFLILTSHGSQDGVAVQAGKRVETLSPAHLAAMLDRAGVRHRVVVISACYSGVFIRPLATEDTLVITAADAEHSSFGCQ